MSNLVCNHMPVTPYATRRPENQGPMPMPGKWYPSNLGVLQMIPIPGK